MKVRGILYKTLIESISLEQIQELIAGIEIASKSPYSNSFYSPGEITWGSKPDGSYRISDHWNFYSHGDIHCQTTNEPMEKSWSVGIYSAETGKYTILKSFPKDYTRLDALRASRRQSREIKNTYRQDRIYEIYQSILRKRAKEARERKIKNKRLWVECEVNEWSYSRGRAKFLGTSKLVGKLVWESKTGNSFILEFENGNTREIRKCNYYKELPRKPRKKTIKL
ncbi:hypothetical protein [Bergeyella zoohelcum]|uniref:Uncharacterized protein n=1 Tax=Bergeyella zoohelcum TaxID=1015 RepID=A0A376BZR1_9FLAO|nr:hypothetical protein [Bergeyella zoohelcum]EKB60777.1 hypothetical protein HMPREF9700_00272 [Bergeyella zoohelcum CCUG 30536]SSZ47132.1 Uncharacterised protein [Bergeyella zoohelcum]